MANNTPTAELVSYEDKCKKLTKYLESMEGLKEIEAMVRQGYNLEQLAKHYHIPSTVLYSIAMKTPAILQTMCISEEAFLDSVELSLGQMCHVQKYKETTLTMGPNGEVLRMTRKTKEVPPNMEAVKYVLNNRRSADWSSTFDNDRAGSNTKPVVIVDTVTARYKAEKALEAKRKAEAEKGTEPVVSGDVI